MTNHPLEVGAIVSGLMLPEPIQIVFIQTIGSSLKVGGRGLRTREYHEVLLDKDQISQLKVFPTQELFDGDPNRFRLGIEAHRLALAYEYDPYFSLSIARVDPVPHQLEAVYDFILPLPRIRFLLADDAGAGKTIMAGLLLKELKIRGLVQRTLIIVPANLSFQWQRELQDKFRERFDILRGVDLRSAYGTNPWQEKSQIITSMDWAKRDEVKESLRRITWHLIIVDEAHKMSASDEEHKSDRYMLGEEILSQKTDHLLLLTATPHKGDPENFCLFLRLLDKDVYGDVKSLEDAMRRNYAPFYLRRVKEALVKFPDPETGVVEKIFTKREVRTARFDLDGEEYAFYDSLTRYVQDQSIRAAADETPRGRALGFTMAMLQRRFASSTYAVRRSLERRKERLEKRLSKPEPPQVFDEKKLEDLDELPDDEAARLLDEVEVASLSEDRDSIRQEIGEISKLIGQALVLEKREIESKLKKLHEVITDQNIFGDPKTKLLIFTEHKETLDYLVRKLREWGLKVTQIHGGMRSGDRDTSGTRLYAEREFREEAQVLVATEAAGEGINLEFCWLMINYDIPWNPMRLEQRMGRIHRYGQEHDCLVFNFVAGNTREGQVLDRLLDRLKEIRNELGTDQVFDVVGMVFPANQLERMIRDLYTGRTTLQALLDRVVKEVDIDRFNRIFHSTLEGLAKKEINLGAIIGKSAEARERRLVPEVVQQFFLQAAPLVGLHPTIGKNGTFRIGKIPRILYPVADRLESRFGRLGREYKWVVFDKKLLTEDPTVEWVTPGHPLFEAVREESCEVVQDDLRKGSVFYNLHREDPYRLDVYAASIKDGRGRTLHRRLFVVETSLDGNLHIRQPTVFLDLNPAPFGMVPPSPGTPLPDQAIVELALVEKALKPFLAEVSGERTKELETISRHLEISLKTLIDRQNVQLAGLVERQRRGDDVALAVGEAEKRLDELNDRLEGRHSELERERQLTIGDITHIGRAWVLSHPEREGYASMVRDEEIEGIAMERAMTYEREHGWIPEDVSRENRGFDILSKQPEIGSVRFIEVKGRAAVGEIAMTKNEHDTAGRLGKDYWLYVVFDCANKPRLIPVHNPARLEWKPIVKIEHFQVGVDVILGEEK